MTIEGRDAIYVVDGKRTYSKEGYMIAPAIIAKSGILPYYARELGLKDRAPNTLIKVYRSPEALADAVPSFENKPITLDHPPEGVDASSWRQLAVGEVRDVIAEGDRMHATLIVRDKAAIDEIKKGRQQLSNGYTFDLHRVRGNGYEFEQQNIQGNHVAIVDRARCGPSCVVGDREPIHEEQENKKMVRLMLDGYPPEVDENTAALVITRLQKEVADAKAKSESDLNALRAELTRPAKLKIGDAMFDQAQLSVEIEARDNKIKELQAKVMTPEKARAEFAAQQKLIATVKDMLPKLTIPETVENRWLCTTALRQMGDSSPVVNAQINAMLDGVRIDDADEASLIRAVKTVHAAHQADEKNKGQRDRNESFGRDVFRDRSTGDTSALSGRDKWVHNLERLREDNDGEDLNAN